MEENRRDVMRFACVDPAYLPMIWAQIGEYLEAAVAHSAQHEWTGAELFARIAEREFVLLVAFEPAREGEAMATLHGGVVINLGHKADGGAPYMAVIACGGRRMEEWIERAIDVSMVLARRAGCDEVVVVGRQGWVRRLAHRGLRLRAVIATAPVPAESHAGADAALLESI